MENLNSYCEHAFKFRDLNKMITIVSTNERNDKDIKIQYFSAMKLHRRILLCETASTELPQLQQRRLSQ